MIKLSNIYKSYAMDQNRFMALKGIDLQIKEGEFVAIMGQSGSGKSTLLNVLGILDDYDSGEYYLDGKLIKDLTDLEAAAFRNKTIGFVFQSFNLIATKTAIENVALPLFYQGASREERITKALALLKLMGLKDWAKHKPDQLSGGQKQRVAIARALITDPKIILADEPTGALDSQTSIEIMELLKDINDSGKTVIVVTHEVEVANKTNRIIRLKDGLVEFDKISKQKYNEVPVY